MSLYYRPPYLDRFKGYAMGEKLRADGSTYNVVVRFSDGKEVLDMDKYWQFEEVGVIDSFISHGLISINDFSKPKLYVESTAIGNVHHYPRGLFDIEKKDFVNDFRYFATKGTKEDLIMVWGIDLADYKPPVTQYAFHYGFLDLEGNIVISGKELARKLNLDLFMGSELQFNPFSNGYAVFHFPKPGSSSESCYGLIDKSGNIVIEPKYSYLGNYSDGLLMATKIENGIRKNSYIDIRENVIINLHEDLRINPFSDGEFKEGLAAIGRDVIINGLRVPKYGYIDKKGNWVVEPKYMFTHDASEGFLLVVDDDWNTYYLDVNNNYRPMGYYKTASSKKELFKNSRYNFEKYITSTDKPSSWAIEEVRKAFEYNLTTDVVMKNYQNHITREEFSELVVKLYEALSGRNVITPTENPFVDTTNKEVLKASQLGIVSGVGNGRFSPNGYITREQMAAMLYRTLEVANPNVDLSIEISNGFSDQGEISSWALDATNYMSSNGIVQGVGNNQFRPKLLVSKEQAIALIKRVYEMYSK